MQQAEKREKAYLRHFQFAATENATENIIQKHGPHRGRRSAGDQRESQLVRRAAGRRGEPESFSGRRGSLNPRLVLALTVTVSVTRRRPAAASLRVRVRRLGG